MPNINTQTLNGIPNISELAMTQPEGSLRCGAYALIGAIGAFGKFPNNLNITYADNGPEEVNNQSTFNQDMDYIHLAETVYTVTGILNVPTAVPELISAGNMYNSLAAMAQVAINLGMQIPTINVLSTAYDTLRHYYPNEENRCVGVVGGGNVITNVATYAAPQENQTHVVCVSNADGSLHWIAQGSDGNFYDSANGSVDNQWNPVNYGDAIGDYLFAGLWIVISED